MVRSILKIPIEIWIKLSRKVVGSIRNHCLVRLVVSEIQHGQYQGHYSNPKLMMNKFCSFCSIWLCSPIPESLHGQRTAMLVQLSKQMMNIL